MPSLFPASQAAQAKHDDKSRPVIIADGANDFQFIARPTSCAAKKTQPIEPIAAGAFRERVPRCQPDMREKTVEYQRTHQSLGKIPRK
jgi:hypothetical protein